MTAKATHPARAACPVCGDELPDRTGRPGRPAAWCSKSCRQAAHRARRSVERAVAEASAVSSRIAADGYGDVEGAGRFLQEAVLTMCETTAVDTETALGEEGRWEPGVADAARRLARAALAVADLADRHAAVAADYRRARATFRRPEVLTLARDKNPRGSVASTAAEALTTKPGPGNVAAAAAGADATKPAAPAHAADVVDALDVDELFESVEDVLEDVRDADGIPQDVLQDVDGVPGMSFAAALDALAAAHAGASGDGPHGELVAAAAAVVRARPARLPARANAALTRLADALPKEVVAAP